jgi:entericidin B
MAGKAMAVAVMLALLGTMGAISGCNTVAGAGQDIESGGQKIHDEAKEVQRKL